MSSTHHAGIVATLSLLAAIAASPAHAQTSYPMLMSLKPVAAQVGQTTEHELSSRYSMYGAHAVLVSGQGVTGEIVQPEKKPDEKPPAQKPNVEKIKLRFTVAPDALPGVRDFRIATPQGVSTVGQLVIARDPIVTETGKNDTLAAAQAITLPATVCGAIEANEDVDFFKFNVASPATLTFHVRSSRLQDRIHDLQNHSDPIISLRNASGTILAQVDNYFFGDPLLSHRFEQPGDYYLEIRDVRYQGNAHWQYSVEISDRAFVTNVHPLAVAPGAETPLELVGFNLPTEKLNFTLPTDIPEGPHWLALPLAGSASNPAPLIASRLPLVLETADDNNAPEKAQPLAIPGGVSGRIERDGDLDCYTFEAKKGEAFSFEVLARRQQSMLDSVLRILNEKGAQVAENDDLNTGRHNFADSWIENWTAPADGRYTLELRDLHLRGGPAFVYFLQATRAEPYFTLDTDSDKTMLAPGGAAAIFARAYRKNGFAGEIQLGIEELPEGVSATCGRILADGKDGVIVLQAAADAQPSLRNIRVIGTAAHPRGEGEPPLELRAIARPMQEIYFPGGGRGHYPVEMHTLSVGEPMDVLTVKVSPIDIALKPGGSQKVDIVIERAAGFDKNVTLDCYFRHLGSVFGDSLPKGVTIETKDSKTLLTGRETQGHITLKCAADAKPVEKQQFVMMANVSINFVMKMTYSSPPMTLSIEQP
jgi:hypothetical protein